MKARQTARRRGFTLIEMIVVIVIIAILAGLVFKLTQPASKRLAKVETVAKLERLKAALEEFYADYGQYPPVPDKYGPQPMGYEYPVTNGMRQDLQGSFSDKTWSRAPLFTFGLMAFLAPRYSGRASQAWPTLLQNESWTDKQWDQFNTEDDDQERDMIFARRVAPFLDGITETHESARMVDNNVNQAYTNLYLTVQDGWDRDFIYRSAPPHQSYLLFSRGPDGAYDSESPGDRNKEANKDNIYGHVGH